MLDIEYPRSVVTVAAMRAVARFAGVFPIQPWLMRSLRSSRAIDVLFAIATPRTGKKNEAMSFIQRYLGILLRSALRPQQLPTTASAVWLIIVVVFQFDPSQGPRSASA
jgi:hypothetical protein